MVRAVPRATVPCLRATVLRFVFKMKNAEYYKIVEAMEIVGSRRIVETSWGYPAETAKNGIVRSSQANRRPNVNRGKSGTQPMLGCQGGKMGNRPFGP